MFKTHRTHGLGHTDSRCLASALIVLLLLSAGRLRADDDAGATDQPVRLAPMEVYGTQDSDDFRVATTTTATKTDTSILDLPQSVSTIPRQEFVLEGARSLEDVLANVAGVSPSVGDGQRDQVYIRGFSAVNDEYTDGVRDSEMYFRDLANIEEVDVIKGPAAALYGHGSAGGLIDRVTRKPVDSPVGEFDLIAGSWGDWRTQLDAGGPLVAHQLDYRLDAAFENSGGFRDQYALVREHVSPSLAWTPSSDTHVLLQVDWQQDRRTDDLGIPALVGPPGSGFPGTAPAVAPSSFYGSPDARVADRVQSDVGSVAVTVNHRLGDDTELHDVVRVEHYTLDRNNVLPTGVFIPGGGVFNGDLSDVWVNRSDRHFLRSETDLFNQLEASRVFTVAGMENTVLAGLEAGHQTASANTAQFADPAVALVNPVLTDPPAGEAPSSHTLNSIDANTAGLYLQDQVSLARDWKALVGVRLDYFAVYQDSDLGPVADFSNVNRAVSPRAGLLWEPTADLSFYASASRSFEPSGDGLSIAASNTALAPEVTTGGEIGAKENLFGGQATATIALFDLERDITETDPVSGVVSNVGMQRSRGVELGLDGRLSAPWRIGASYSLIDPRIVDGGRDAAGILLNGHLPALVPRNSASVFTTYDLFGGFGVGLGSTYLGGRFTSNDDQVNLPAFAVVNTVAYWRRGRWEARINFNNVLDHRYLATAGEGTDYTGQTVMPGAPFNVQVALTRHF